MVFRAFTSHVKRWHVERYQKMTPMHVHVTLEMDVKTCLNNNPRSILIRVQTDVSSAVRCAPEWRGSGREQGWRSGESAHLLPILNFINIISLDKLSCYSLSTLMSEYYDMDFQQTEVKSVLLKQSKNPWCGR